MVTPAGAWLALLTGGAPARATYGDSPQRTYEEIELLYWLNAARVAPDAFESDYLYGGCAYGDGASWPDEPVEPVYLHGDADEAAEQTLDQLEELLEEEQCVANPCIAGNGNVAAWARTAAQPFDSRDAVLSTALCSEEARQVLFRPDEMAIGVDVRALDSTRPLPDEGEQSSDLDWGYALSRLREDQTLPYAPARVGFCDRDGTCGVVWADSATEAGGPELLEVTDGTWSMELTLQEGQSSLGLYQHTAVEKDFTDCDSPYWFVWESVSGYRGTFPAAGALTGPGCPEPWVGRPLPAAWFGCSHERPDGERGALATWIAFAAALAIRLRR